MIEQAMQLHKRYRKMVEGFTQEQFEGWFNEFFRLYPFIAKITWEQYAPSFNDGDPCTFDVHDPDIELTPAFIAEHPELEVTCSEYGYEEEDDDGNPVPDRCISKYSFTKEQQKALPLVADALSSLEDLFKAEDILCAVFGENAKVVVTPEQIVRELT